MIKSSCIENKSDVCILISGDADFVPALNIIKEQGKDVLVASVHKGFSKELRDNFEYFILKEKTFMKCGRDKKDMKQNVIIVHGIPCEEEKERNPQTRTYDKHWIPWLKEELVKRNIKTKTPLMPIPWKPNYIVWKKELEKNKINGNSILVAHSGSCAFIVRWLGDTKTKIKKLVLVAPWKIPSKEFPDEENELYNYEIDKKISFRIKNIIIFTSNDEKEDGKKSAKIFNESLKGKLIELHNKGHFTYGDMKTNEFPELLDEIIN